jgi:hypothetical protein
MLSNLSTPLLRILLRSVCLPFNPYGLLVFLQQPCEFLLDLDLGRVQT